MNNDTEFEVQLIEKVEPCPNGWYLTFKDGLTLFCTNENCVVAPEAGEWATLYGRGLGYPVRGIRVGKNVYRYQTVEQHEAERAAQCAERDKRRVVETAEMELREAAVRESGEKYAWREGMGEISGFGGGYEEACRKMVRAGLRWLDEHPNADPKFHGYKRVFGIINEDNEDAKELSKAVFAACSDCSGAMHQASISACLYVKKNGWDAYCAAMSKQETPQ